MSYANSTVEVTTTATQILWSPTGESDGILVRNNGPFAVFLGGSTVTADESSTGGFQLTPGEKVTLSTTGSASDDLWGICAEGMSYVSYIFV